MKDLGGVTSVHRLKLRCQIDPINECWMWSMSVYKSTGLPRVHVRFPWEPTRKKMTTGKRAAVELRNGKPLPSGWFVWTTCGHRLCCNPDHAGFGDAAAYGRASAEYGWHKNKAAHILANRAITKTKRKLTDEQAEEIRRSPLPVKKLASMYGIAPSSAAQIKNGARYAMPAVKGSSVFTWGGA